MTKNPTITLNLQAALDAKRHYERKANLPQNSVAKTHYLQLADEMGRVATYLHTEPGAVSVNYDEGAAAYWTLFVMSSNGQIPTAVVATN